MREVYDLVNTVKIKFSTSRVVLSGVLWRRDVSWRRTEAVNSRREWVAQTLGVTSVDPNSWVDEWDLSFKKKILFYHTPHYEPLHIYDQFNVHAWP